MDDSHGVTEEPTVAEVLRDAARLLRERGWVRGEFGEAGGPRCAVGAILETVDAAQPYKYLFLHPAETAVERFLGLPVSRQSVNRSLPKWNDRVAEDGEHVAQTFEKAAAAWEEVQGL